ncbi:hypothetical protein A2130_01070 [Candidatus Woesebacteria bacterium GWC2_33_12]|uniref:Uncharacterized protein n=1 Tax=Candidatus Woesebacteria bacterium GW2011_GWB1_33_22 TaxID=1618566 RepID=A0A0G0C2C8_9BACT|nr:MAG: hypothetical protein UR29_C0002G0105 [Candidatus Woesebacteria bacterium GW2011_GWC2_33_12]KKP42577.1 MAG: hypothetical protein UR33_C0002G0153 [Candidatus Woesebacteria bacterium GW2011_GWA2_33_20]KKP45320.1 MAG: hypothetical protein UR35_C0002G0153 [Candidatus Woesebacteria bacterium GW2011_GWB1_33_22]KKP47148.1 MAG: hypothetical protein UR37_C0002G0060 [Microgenomates group bacterium GW2011_GWC1_33_28]KKP50990.1 MAG: hypothetical protein UR41_C0002G0154 [Candidatus Woesebacteria bact
MLGQLGYEINKGNIPSELVEEVKVFIDKYSSSGKGSLGNRTKAEQIEEADNLIKKILGN